MRACHVLMLLLLDIALPAHAEVADPLEIPRDGTVYRLGFCARPSPDSAAGVPAHAFVALASVQPSEKRTYQAVGAVAGSQPHGLIGFSAVLNPMPSPLKSLDFGLLISHCLVVEVKRQEFMAARQATEAKLVALSTVVPKADVWGAYGLSAEEVVGLFVQILSPLRVKGLLVPQRVERELPFAYLRRLIDQNLRRLA